MDLIGIKKLVYQVAEYAQKAEREVSLGEWGDPELYWYYQDIAWKKLLQKCRGKHGVRQKYLAKFLKVHYYIY